MKRRTISKKTRKLLNNSGIEKCPICNRQELLVEHHIEGKDIRNPNHPSNLAYVCDNCHRKIHTGSIMIEGWFQTTNGKELFWYGKQEESFSGNETSPYVY